MHAENGYTRTWWAIALLVPVPTLAVLVGLVWLPGSFIGQAFFVAAKIWMILLPLAWYRWVMQRWPRPRWPTGVEIAVGGMVGMAIAGVIVAAYVWIGRTAIDPELLRQVATNTGMLDLTAYLLMAVYWIFGNSLIEEIVWRWFVLERFCLLFSVRAAIIFAALGFSAHHVVATSVYFAPQLVVLVAIGVAFGGLVWGYLAQRYGSIWSCYISHILADIAIFSIGYQLLLPTFA